MLNLQLSQGHIELHHLIWPTNRVKPRRDPVYKNIQTLPQAFT